VTQTRVTGDAFAFVFPDQDLTLPEWQHQFYAALVENDLQDARACHLNLLARMDMHEEWKFARMVVPKQELLTP
jgi:hypothetical protein